MMSSPRKTGVGRSGVRSAPGTLWVLIVTAVVSGIWSYVGATERDVWFFELVPGAIGVCGVVLLGQRFRFSAFVYLTICVAFVFIATGARYTYSAVPLANGMSETLGWSRNYFDRVGHFVQGLTVGMMTREVLLRRTTLVKRCGIPILTIAFALAFSAFYELIEWGTVVAFYPNHGPEWLGLQGDPWDAQQDMLMALLGAIVATTILVPFHNRSIRRLRQVLESR